MTRWIFLGDDSRWRFICWLLKIAMNELPKQGHKTILVKHGTLSYQLNEEDALISITTFHLPPYMEIFIPAYTANLQFHLNEFDRCAIFEMYPFGRESTEDLAKMLEMSKKHDPMMLFVLVDLPDEIEGDSLISVKNRKITLLNRNRDVLVARGRIDVLDILHWHRPLVNDLRWRMQHELEDIRSQVNSFYEYYQDYIEHWKSVGCLNSTARANITAFANVKGRPHIWKCYNEAAVKILFPQSLLKPPPRIGNLYEAVDLYKKILYNPTSIGKNLASFIWNVEADVKQLTEKIKQKFAQVMMSPKKYHDFLTTDEYNSEHIYKSLVEKSGGRFYGIKDDYFKIYEKFVCKDVSDIIKAELDEHVFQLKSMMN